MSCKLIGSQEPRLRIEPRRVYTDGPDACILVGDLGISPDEWQRMVLDAWLGRDESDRYTATTCGLSVPRQNGKNAVLEWRELYGLVVIGERILHTAHEVKTARKAFERLASYFTDPDHPELTEMLMGGSEKTGIRRTNGQEAIKLQNGGSIEFSARSKGAARGFTVDVVVFDEASFLTDAQVEAIMSTMAAAPLGNRQLIYTGTPPAPDMPCEVFGRVRRAALGGSDKRACWHEWSVSGDELPTLEEIAACRDLWYRCNPALGIRLELEFTESEWNTMSADGFLRERLGWWFKEDSVSLVSEEAWARLETDCPPQGGKLAIGIKFSVDGSTVSIAAALKEQGEIDYVELIARERINAGVTWIAEWCRERRGKIAVVVIDGVGNAASLESKLSGSEAAAGKRFSRKAVVLPSALDVAQAASTFVGSVEEGTVTHFGQQELTASVVGSSRRQIGKSGNWGFGGNDPTPAEAASLALWGVRTTRRDPSRKQELL